jgi:hypothetical protein
LQDCGKTAAHEHGQAGARAVLACFVIGQTGKFALNDLRRKVRVTGKL